MKISLLFVSMFLLTTLSFANHRGDEENKCRNECSVKRSDCREICFNEHKKDNTYIGMNQCQNQCNVISNKCKNLCEYKS